MPKLSSNDKTKNEFNKKIEELKQKLTELQDFMMLDGMLYSSRVPEIEQLLDELKQQGGIFTQQDSDRIIRAGNTYLKIAKDGKFQVKTDSGVTSLKPREGSTFTTASTSWVDVTGSPYVDDIEIIPEKSHETKIILQAITDLATKLNHQHNQLKRILSEVTRMREDGEINSTTFNKLDQFLKEYYENPYQDGNY